MTAISSTVRQEMEIGRRHTPDVAWPTLALLGSVVVLLCISTGLALAGSLPMWVSAVGNTVVLYGTYTVVHEGIHDNIVPNLPRWRWVNMTAAFIAALPLWILIYPHRKQHLIHHTRCNTEEDPDIYARGPFLTVALWRIPRTALAQLNPVLWYRMCKEVGTTRRETVFSMITFAMIAGFALWAVAAGYGFELLVLWLLPFLISYTVMLIFFTWVPHYPHTETGRYRNTRCSLWPGANILTQGESLHLIHHIMPWIPWYRYEPVFREIRPYLEQHGAPIDGFVPRKPQPIAQP